MIKMKSLLKVSNSNVFVSICSGSSDKNFASKKRSFIVTTIVGDLSRLEARVFRWENYAVNAFTNAMCLYYRHWNRYLRFDLRAQLVKRNVLIM